ncbi:MAG: ribulose-phosphate 3-epimerase [Candidatus Kapabacteria bacterium]|nr:ribulose-phosphate 3-epimerase [Candidatus Kapabacteria bacterium]
MNLIAPSLLSADPLHIGRDIAACEAAGADILHVDVMDGHFVPPITFGPGIVSALRRGTSLPLDCHLMVTNPDHHVEQFAAAGAAWISIHAEAAPHLHRSLQNIRAHGCRPGVVLNPLTPLDYAFEAAGEADFILLMSVNPGYGGQAFIPGFLRRCERLRTWLDSNGLGTIPIEVDGGVKLDNVRSIVDAGASILVSGSGLFSGNLADNIAQMRQLVG